jgi:hypothetical protein
MIDLIIALYDLDVYRIALWDTLAAFHMSGVILFLLDFAGFTVYEDFTFVFTGR